MKSKDLTDCLNNDQLNELIELATEDEHKDVVSFQEFIQPTEKWRIDSKAKKYLKSIKSAPSKNPY